MSDTIAAAATANAVSAIGIVRLSGDEAIEIVSRVFTPYFGVDLRNAENRKLYIGRLCDKNGSTIDECLCTVSRAPNSYTGENTAELQCHGSPTVIRSALEALFRAGARQARAGEFTKRAFLNGRMDLTQAEAVIDLIESETANAAKNAAGQLGRAISRKTDKIYADLVDIMSHFHAVIDYPDEDIEPFELESYIGVMDSSERTLKALLDTFERGRIMKNGVKCAIIGRPNAGKSSLLNALVGYDRAIVTDIPGTTRDTVEEKCVVGGVLLRLTDTAGLRDTEDAVEKIGVERAAMAAVDADVILAVVDASSAGPEDDTVLKLAGDSGKPWILVANKSDLFADSEAAERLGRNAPVCVTVSAKEGTGLDTLGDAIGKLLAKTEVPAGEILTNARQAECVSTALSGIRDARSAMAEGMTPDAVLTCVEDAISALGDLTGRSMRDDVVSRIFERFCVGK